jgi:hypothetical protein
VSPLFTQVNVGGVMEIGVPDTFQTSRSQALPTNVAAAPPPGAVTDPIASEPVVFEFTEKPAMALVTPLLTSQPRA